MAVQRAPDPADSPAPPVPDAGRPSRFRFSRHQRIVRHAEFQRVLDEGVRAADDRLTMWALPNGLPHPRLGLIIGRQHGPAVRRNRLKRIIRESFRLLQHDLPPGLDLACSPRVGSHLERDGCMESLTRLADKLSRRIARNREGTPRD